MLCAAPTLRMMRPFETIYRFGFTLHVD